MKKQKNTWKILDSRNLNLMTIFRNMKRVFLPILTAVLMIMSGCGNSRQKQTVTSMEKADSDTVYISDISDCINNIDTVDTSAHITMKTADFSTVVMKRMSVFTVYIAGSGELTIERNDSTPAETHILRKYDKNWNDRYNRTNNNIEKFAYNHRFSGNYSLITKIKSENITHFICWLNALADLDVSRITTLTKLDCNENALSELDVSKNTQLKMLTCSANRLSSLDVSNNINLTILWCDNNHYIPSLDVSKNTMLTELLCHNNQLTVLDVSKNTALKILECGWNPLNNLDVSKNTALTWLHLYGSQLTSLDVSKNNKLTYLDCCHNSLTALDVSNNTELEILKCTYNQLSADALNALFETLHNNTVSGEKTIEIGNNPGANDCNRSIAENKGWVVINWLLTD